MSEPRRPRILVVTRNLPPLLGGMERLNWHMLEQLSRWADVRVVAPRGAAEPAPDAVGVSETPGRSLATFIAGSLLLAPWRALTARPSVVIAGSGLTAPVAWLAARLVGACAVAYVHGLDIVVPNTLYQKAWLPFLRRMDRVVANSMATADLARRAAIPAERIGVVHPGVQLSGADSSVPGAADHFRRERNIGRGPLLLSVGRLTARKGLREFIRDVLPRVVARRSDVLLFIAGDAPVDALYGRGETVQSVLDTARQAGVEAHVRVGGRLSEDDLQAAYATANVHVFPIRHVPTDPEGFGMVAVEAAAHGLPTVAYACGGVVDAVAEGVSGRLVKAGDSKAMAEAVLAMLTEPPDRASITAFARRFSWDAFGAGLRKELVQAGMPSCPAKEASNDD